MSGIAAGDLQALLIADQTIAPPAPQAARCVTLASWPWRRQINEWISIQHNAWPEGGQQRQLTEQYERWATSDGMGEGTRDSINGSFAWKTYCARSNSIKKSSLLSLCLSLSHSASSSLSLSLSFLCCSLSGLFSFKLAEGVCVFGLPLLLLALQTARYFGLQIFEI